MPGLDKRGLEYLHWMARDEERERQKEDRVRQQERRDATRRRVSAVVHGKAFIRGR